MYSAETAALGLELCKPQTCFLSAETHHPHGLPGTWCLATHPEIFTFADLSFFFKVSSFWTLI